MQKREQVYAPASDGSHASVLDGARTVDPFSTARLGESDVYRGPVWEDRRGRTFVVFSNARRDVRYAVARGCWVSA